MVQTRILAYGAANKALHRTAIPLHSIAPVSFAVEAVEKVPKRILGRDAEKNDLTECATINNLIFGKGQ